MHYNYAIQKGEAMARPKIHPRVMLRHPELSEKDVLHAWEHAIASLPRVSKNPDEYVSLGFDGRGRLLEVVGVRGDGGN